MLMAIATLVVVDLAALALLLAALIWLVLLVADRKARQ